MLSKGAAAAPPDLGEHNHHAVGLRRDALSFTETLAQSIANVAPTATPAVNLQLVFASSGNGTWFTYALATAGTHEIQGRPGVVGGQELCALHVLRRRRASGEHRNEIVGIERQAENLRYRIGRGRPDVSLILHGVIRGEPAFVDGDDQQRRTERRERFEADRARRLDEQDAPETLALAALFQRNIGKSPQVGELAGALCEQRERPTGVVADGFPGRRGRACGDQHEQRDEEETTERPSGRP